MKKLLVTAMLTASTFSVASPSGLTVDISDIQTQLCIYASKASSLGALIDTDAGPHVCVLNESRDHAVWETDPDSKLLNEDQRQILLSLMDSKRSLLKEVGANGLNPLTAQIHLISQLTEEMAPVDKLESQSEEPQVDEPQVDDSYEGESQEVAETSSTYGYVHENMESLDADSKQQDELDEQWTALEKGFNMIKEGLKFSSDDVKSVDSSTTELGNIKTAPLKNPEG